MHHRKEPDLRLCSSHYAVKVTKEKKEEENKPWGGWDSKPQPHDYETTAAKENVLNF